MDYDPQQQAMYQHSPPMAQPKELGKISHPSDKEFHLELMSHPLHAIAIEWTDEKKPRSHKKRKNTDWPLEPPPVLALKIANGGTESEHHNALTACPNVFCLATLMDDNVRPVSPEIMRGRHSSSLIKIDKSKSPKLKTDAPAIGVFLFDQIHIRYPGRYCLLFTLFEMQMSDHGMHAVVHNVVRSKRFDVLPQPKRLPKPEAPSDILVALAAQGAKIKIRKPNEERTKKKQDWSYDPHEHEFTQQAMDTSSMHTQHPGQLPGQMPGQIQGQLQPQIPGQLPGQFQGLPNPMSMQQSNFMQQPMGMTATPQYEMPISINTSQSLMMPQQYPMEMNFGSFQDPNQQFHFGSYPQHGFGGYGHFQ